jgi:hypothetical protein
MTIIGIFGAIGSGKSHSQLKYGLMYADKREKQIVANFALNVKEVYRYACLPAYLDSFLGSFRYELHKLIYVLSSSFKKAIGKKPKKFTFKPMLPFLKEQIEKGRGISWIINPENLQDLMIPESVVLLDEAGIFLNAREFAKTPKELLSDLAQSRKDGVDLIYCAQFDEQIDKQLRLLTQFFWYCSGMTFWNKKMRRPELKFKNVHIFDAATFKEWYYNPKARTNGIKTRFAYAIDTFSGALTGADKQIFNCFNSFTRLDIIDNKNLNIISTLDQCLLTERPDNWEELSKAYFEIEHHKQEEKLKEEARKPHHRNGRGKTKPIDLSELLG